jgi:hypothetical protein
LDIIGLQIANEAKPDSGLLYSSEMLHRYYDSCIAAISAIDTSIPIVIPYGNNLAKALDYSRAKNTANPASAVCPVVVDTHLYWVETDKSPQAIIAEIPSRFTQLDAREGSVVTRGAVQLIVGEYSNALNDVSWTKAGATPKQDVVGRFGATQSRHYQRRAGGAFFWSWKMDYLPENAEWDFKTQASPDPATGLYAIVAPTHTLASPYDIATLLRKAQEREDERMYAAVKQHVAYWDFMQADAPAEHWRFEIGWKVGYKDAYCFFAGMLDRAVQQGNKIGNLELWVLKRIRESGMRGKFVWEFEMGLRRGIMDFNAVVGM